jgi:hypothetical protein
MPSHEWDPTTTPLLINECTHPTNPNSIRLLLVYLSRRASRSHSNRHKISPSRTGPFTLRTIDRAPAPSDAPVSGFTNSTRTCVTLPVLPVRPSTRDTLASLTPEVSCDNIIWRSAQQSVCVCVWERERWTGNIVWVSTSKHNESSSRGHEEWWTTHISTALYSTNRRRSLGFISY